MDKLKVGNFKGMNLTQTKMMLVGELAFAMNALEESVVEHGGEHRNQLEMSLRVKELKKILAKLEERLNPNEVNTRYGYRPDKKLGIWSSTASATSAVS